MLIFILTFGLMALITRWISDVMPPGITMSIVSTIMIAVLSPLVGLACGLFLALCLSQELDERDYIVSGTTKGVVFMILAPFVVGYYRKRRLSRAPQTERRPIIS